MPLYKIVDNETGDIRLVNATNNSRALKHVTEERFVVSTPDPLETAALVNEGIAVETAVPPMPRTPAAPAHDPNQIQLPSPIGGNGEPAADTGDGE